MGSNKLISTSYDGIVRRMDVEKGAFEQVFSNKAGEDAFFSDGHLMAEDRLLMLSDGVGDVTAVSTFVPTRRFGSTKPSGRRPTPLTRTQETGTFSST
eukprot:g7261.t1